MSRSGGIRLEREGEPTSNAAWQGVHPATRAFVKPVDTSRSFAPVDGCWFRLHPRCKKVWDKVKELNDDLLFIHINISASNCMSRIASVMEKLFLPDNSIQIKLK
jgi:hypothetical protein